MHKNKISTVVVSHFFFWSRFLRKEFPIFMFPPNGIFSKTFIFFNYILTGKESQGDSMNLMFKLFSIMIKVRKGEQKPEAALKGIHHYSFSNETLDLFSNRINTQNYKKNTMILSFTKLRCIWFSYRCFHLYFFIFIFPKSMRLGCFLLW